MAVAKTQSKVTAFLSCAAACPVDTLRKLSPVLLARLYHHLGDGSLPMQPHSQVPISTAFITFTTVHLMFEQAFR